MINREYEEDKDRNDGGGFFFSLSLWIILSEGENILNIFK